MNPPIELSYYYWYSYHHSPDEESQRIESPAHQ